MTISNSHINPSSENDEITFKELIMKIQKWWRYFWSKWLIILIFGLIGGGLGLLYAITRIPVYTATTTLVLEEGNGRGGLGQYAGVAAILGINMGGGDAGLFTGDNILELYKSNSMIRKSLLTQVDINGDKQSLINRYIEFNQLREKWEDDRKLKNISFDDTEKFTRLQDSVIKNIIKDINKNYLSVSKPDKVLSIIEVQVKSIDELFSKTFAVQLVKTVNDFYIELKTKKALDNLFILQHQTDSVRAAMNEAMYESTATLDATPNLNPTRQVLRSSIQRSQYNVESNKAILGELIKNLELSKMSLRKETPLIQVIDEPVLPLEKDQVGKLKGVILGGLLFGFLTILYFFLKKKYKEVMEE